ncbi:hypothetical protein GLOTRDRAFT_141186 [Gloeophyllum trabeum ATCC 11539]|uniref:Uncharacterized protein n=1 Tax=Gloeophyllum trabeum (strain ATCC 11539 / FP-39264 / Madison 617) TaxID=670483 RepID=S7R9X1_GLOTA|nr:uncharacterized protein GLOTRDRAFT_141186 [Gloeophyllum trabeum ATCC 11539]EPQ51035.1 hypothetical protein GLOTRDRAFT_141186 [Gloeophyllum trabeum ATCC 11539]
MYLYDRRELRRLAGWLAGWLCLTKPARLLAWGCYLELSAGKVLVCNNMKEPVDSTINGRELALGPAPAQYKK